MADVNERLQRLESLLGGLLARLEPVQPETPTPTPPTIPATPAMGAGGHSSPGTPTPAASSSPGSTAQTLDPWSHPRTWKEAKRRMNRAMEAGGFFSDWKSLVRLEQASVREEAAAFKSLFLYAEGGLFLLGPPPATTEVVDGEGDQRQHQWYNQQASWFNLMKAEAYWGLAKAAAKQYAASLPASEVDMLIFECWGDWPRYIAELSKANRARLVDNALTLKKKRTKDTKDPKDPKDTKAPAGKGAGRGANA